MRHRRHLLEIRLDHSLETHNNRAQSTRLIAFHFVCGRNSFFGWHFTTAIRSYTTSNGLLGMKSRVDRSSLSACSDLLGPPRSRSICPCASTNVQTHLPNPSQISRRPPCDSFRGVGCCRAAAAAAAASSSRFCSSSAPPPPRSCSPRRPPLQRPWLPTAASARAPPFALRQVRDFGGRL